MFPFNVVAKKDTETNVLTKERTRSAHLDNKCYRAMVNVARVFASL
jgi:U3 small nucleolar ribonucleoprotein component